MKPKSLATSVFSNVVHPLPGSPSTISVSPLSRIPLHLAIYICSLLYFVDEVHLVVEMRAESANAKILERQAHPNNGYSANFVSIREYI